MASARASPGGLALAALLAAASLACAGPSPPSAPRRLAADWSAPAGRARAAEGFRPAAAASRFCELERARAELRFDGSWRVELAARCAKDPRYGDCTCRARARIIDEGEALFTSDWRTHELRAGGGWKRLVLEGSERSLRLAYPRVDAVELEWIEIEPG